MPNWTPSLRRARQEDPNGYIICLHRSSHEGDRKKIKRWHQWGPHLSHWTSYTHNTTRDCHVVMPGWPPDRTAVRSTRARTGVGANVAGQPRAGGGLSRPGHVDAHELPPSPHADDSHERVVCRPDRGAGTCGGYCLAPMRSVGYSVG
jgi:hypothetical protein